MNTMTLHPPFIIGARLLPALKVGDGYLSFDNGQFIIDGPFGEHTTTSFRPGHGRSLEGQFADMLGFLSAAAESYRYCKLDWSKVDEDDNATLFPRNVVEWAYQHVDEIEMYAFEIEASDSDLISHI